MRMDKIATPIAYSSSGSLVVFGMGLSDIALIVGIITGVGTFAVNWYYRHKESKRRDR